MSEEKALAALSIGEKQIAEIKTVADAKKLLKDIDNVKKLLKAADMYEEKAKAYARMEVAALMRIVELGLTDAVSHNSKRYHALEWVSKLAKDDRAEVARTCSERGLLLEELYHERVVKPTAIDEFVSWSEFAMTEFERKGIVDINEFVAPTKDVPPEIVKSIKDGIRNKIRDAGGHGIGDGSGIYVTTDKALGYAEDIIENKATSIRRDMLRMQRTISELVAIIDEGKYAGKKPELRFDKVSANQYIPSNESIVNFALAIMNIGKLEFFNSDYATARMICWMLNRVGFPIDKLNRALEEGR